MSTNLTVLQGNVPAHLQGAAATAAAERNKAALAGVGSGLSVDRISLKQSRFRLIQGGEETAVIQQNYLDLIVLRVNDGITKTFYDSAWNPNAEAEAPTCYSDDGVAPSPQADKPQARTCAECPQNAWGSKVNPHTGAEAKACGDSKRMSVVPPSDPKRSPFQLSVPAASLKDWGKFVRQLDNLSPSVPYNAIVTRVAFDTNATFPKLEFAPVRYLTVDEFAVADGRYDEQPVKLTAGLAEAAAELHQSKAPASIPGANPAAAAQQKVREQGQAQAETLTQAQPATAKYTGDWAAEPVKQEPVKQEPAQTQDAGDWGGAAESAPVEEPKAEKVAEPAQENKSAGASSAGAALDEVFGGDWDD